MSARTGWEMQGLSEAVVRSFEARVRGTVIQPGDDEYDSARRVWNAAVDRHPALIVRPHQVPDVIAALNFARTYGLPVAVRGGGHSPSGYGTADLGLVVDLSAMERLAIDREHRVASAEAGLTWGVYNSSAHGHGLATPGGDGPKRSGTRSPPTPTAPTPASSATRATHDLHQAGRDQASLRPGQHPAPEPEHPTGELALPDGVGQVRHPWRGLRADRLQGYAARVHTLEQADSRAEQDG